MLQIITYPDPRLRVDCEEIKKPTDPKIKQLISDMLETLRGHEGIGLAAPQVGHNLKLSVIEIDDEVFVLINPKIKSRSGDKIFMEEGCLSFPGKFITIPRYERVKIKAVDANGKKQVIRARGLLARALQHEIDHLNGKLFVDRVEDWEKK